MKFSTIGFLASVLSVVNASPMVVQGAPDPNQVHIDGITYGGTGCPAGTVSQVLSQDLTTVTLIFDTYVASVGPGVLTTEGRKNCQLNFALHYPSGWQYSVFRADYRGYAYMDAGVFGQQQSNYYFSGSTVQGTSVSPFKGPFNQDYLFSDQIAFESVVWSPCGAEGLLNINSQVSVWSTVANGRGQLTTDSVDATFKHILGIQWRQC